ncbi:hypothetical protein GCM10023156_52410 [Novipirellula rosea]|uniref:Uncharacterized protein n=1 Tax=Novipirellula rosea TaxID=1031540 RepID=A0ABP8NFT3_9BACT
MISHEVTSRSSDGRKSVVWENKAMGRATSDVNAMRSTKTLYLSLILISSDIGIATTEENGG